MLSAMEQVPNWEQNIMAFNHGGGHSSVLSPQQWVGEQSLDGLGLSDQPFSGMGDGGQYTQAALDVLKQGLQTAQQIQADKRAGRASKPPKSSPSQFPPIQGGGGGNWIEDNKWLLIAAAVVIGGILLFSVKGKKKSEEKHHD